MRAQDVIANIRHANTSNAMLQQAAFKKIIGNVPDFFS